MSASSTWLPRRLPRNRRASSASVALRLTRKPYEHERKSASKIGSSISRVAACTTRSRIVGMPRGRCFPSAFGMYRRRTAAGRYLPARRSAAIVRKNRSTPSCSMLASVRPSTPAAPRFRFTRFHASRRTSPLHTRSYSAWKRRSGCRLATDHSRRWSSRTLSTGLRPRGKLGPVLPAMPSRLPPSTAPSPQGPFPPVALFVAALTGTTVPSDSRCTRRDFTVGLYAPPCPDEGCADGSLLFHTEP